LSHLINLILAVQGFYGHSWQCCRTVETNVR
jgi:hypothetical protein